MVGHTFHPGTWEAEAVDPVLCQRLLCCLSVEDVGNEGGVEIERERGPWVPEAAAGDGLSCGAGHGRREIRNKLELDLLWKD